MDIISILINAIQDLINEIINAILVVGVALIWGFIIAGVVGVIILLILRTWERVKKGK